MLNVSDMDLCSLLGNLLDNAIEANCKFEQEKRKLQIEIKPYNNMLSIYPIVQAASINIILLTEAY